MYDDAPTEGARSRRDRYGDDWSGGDYQQRHYRDERRSRSRSRDAGRPTDTVILEGLPHSISTSQVRTYAKLITLHRLERAAPVLLVTICSCREFAALPTATFYRQHSIDYCLIPSY